MRDYLANHPLQSNEWGEFRKKTGVKVTKLGGVQVTIHKIPYLSWTIGYVPKGPIPDKEMVKRLQEIGKNEKCIFIQVEPNVRVESGKLKMENLILNSQFSILNSFHPLFTKYTFTLDLTKSEEELLKAMHPKTRYNIRVAQKHGVEVIEDNSDEAFEIYLKLLKETTKRQGFYAHDEKYHRIMWETLRDIRLSSVEAQAQGKLSKDNLTAHLFLAKYKEQMLAAWILLVYKDTLYYPYGASSSLHRETMTSNLLMWEAILFGKKLGLKKFDMWGALGPNPDVKNPWYGFHRFKEGYGPTLTEFVGSFDLVINPVLYNFYKILDKVRWTLLRIKK